MSFSKFDNLEQLLHTDFEKNNVRWRRIIRTEERLALTLLVHKNV
jgi:Ser/Thr protein kinase RdoA (MazF antagonist)